MDYYSSLYCIYRQPVLKIQNFCRRIRENQPNAAEVRLASCMKPGAPQRSRRWKRHSLEKSKERTFPVRLEIGTARLISTFPPASTAAG